jgi:uncharacterized membrane protein YkvA (DUF1232 family)
MSMKFSFTLDDEDLKYFQRLLKDARKYASDEDPAAIIGAVRKVVVDARKTARLPSFAEEAIDTLEALIDMVEDADWALPKASASKVVAALAYFAHSEDLIPDHIPGLGFLDDAIMIKIVETDFKHELWGYHKFSKFRGGAEQRPWTKVARERLPRRLKEKRDQIRDEVSLRREKAQAREGKGLFRW